MKADLKEADKSILRPAWRRVWSRIEAHIDAAVAARTGNVPGAWSVHVPAFLNAASSVAAFGRKLASLQRETIETRRQIGELWQRVEFVRRELLYEFKYTGVGTHAPDAAPQFLEPRIIAKEKIEAATAAGDIRLNLGCGHVALPGYINVDMRELPGVDVAATVDRLPFGHGVVSEIHSAHLVEHFPQEALRRRLLPYWMSLLRPGGTLRAVTPDAAAMIDAHAKGEYPFEEFREVLFGAQDYEGDFHYNLLTPDSMSSLLADAGFTNITVPVAGRRNGKCFEFEIVAQRP